MGIILIVSQRESSWNKRYIAFRLEFLCRQHIRALQYFKQETQP